MRTKEEGQRRMIDMHSHILPYIDDGAIKLKESIQMIKEAKEAGFDSIVSTSHYIEESYNASKMKRQELIDLLNSKLQEEDIEIKIYNGAEAYITPNLIKLIKDDKLPTLNNTKYLLMELPMNSQIIYLDRMISNLVSSGLVPVIAHPERYSYVQENPKMIMNLLDRGAIFQSNYGSIIGVYGREAEKTLKKLLKNDMIYLFGSDCHRKNSIYTEMEPILKKLEKLIGKEKLEELTSINPQRLLEKM